MEKEWTWQKYKLSCKKAIDTRYAFALERAYYEFLWSLFGNIFWFIMLILIEKDIFQCNQNYLYFELLFSRKIHMDHYIIHARYIYILYRHKLFHIICNQIYHTLNIYNDHILQDLQYVSWPIHIYVNCDRWDICY